MAGCQAGCQKSCSSPLPVRVSGLWLVAFPRKCHVGAEGGLAGMFNPCDNCHVAVLEHTDTLPYKNHYRALDTQSLPGRHVNRNIWLPMNCK